MKIYISSDSNQLDVVMIHSYLSNTSYWAKGRTRAEVENSIKNSLCFGMFKTDGQQIGFGRAVTDGTIFAYLMDIFILEDFRYRGFGKLLINHILNHETIRNLKTVALKTKDAHKFYQSNGFEIIGNSPFWMTRDKQEIE